MFLSGKAGRWHSLSKDKRYDFCVTFLRYDYVFTFYDFTIYVFTITFFFFTFLRYDLQQFYLFVLFYLYVYLSL